jgi:serine/threonine-protein kinase
MPWSEVVDIGLHLCAALQHAHDKGIVHRDLKPSNLMVLKDGTVKLTDFGIAKDTDVTALTNANSTVGTAAYMSPEQCRGARDIGHKSDLYSMGIMFYELLTGRKPFVGETPMEVFLQHANNREYKRPAEIVGEVPIWLNALVEQLMEKEIAKRPQNAKAVADSLKLIKDKVAAQRDDGDETARRQADRRRDETEPDSAPLPKKKKKEAAPPFYTRGWFTIGALGLVAAALGVFVYFAFVAVPDAETLFSRAQTLMASNKKEAREGPIADFLRHYPSHEKHAKIREWADAFDFEQRESQLHLRRSGVLKVEVIEPEEKLARTALDKEDEGNLKDAASLWKTLAEKKNDADGNIRAWGLVGDRYLRDVLKVSDDYANLDKSSKPADKLEKLAIEARSKELAAANVMDDSPEAARLLGQAKTKWEDLQRDAKTASPRRWYLLASERLRELRNAK